MKNMILLVFLMIDGGFEMNENDVILGYTIDNFNSQRELLINYTNQIIYFRVLRVIKHGNYLI